MPKEPVIAANEARSAAAQGLTVLVYTMKLGKMLHGHGVQWQAGELIKAIESEGWRLEHVGNGDETMLAVFRCH